jgi:transcription antitermination factor NusG
MPRIGTEIHMEVALTARRCWHAAHTRSRHENRVAFQLHVKGLDFLLPSYHRLVRWSDRAMRAPAPLFPGYIFVNISPSQREQVLQTCGVVSLVSVGGQFMVFDEEEMDRLRLCTLCPSDVEPCRCAEVGHRVRVKDGPFEGWTGTLLEQGDSRRLVITVPQILRAVSINLYNAQVEPAEVEPLNDLYHNERAACVGNEAIR